MSEARNWTCVLVCMHGGRGHAWEARSGVKVNRLQFWQGGRRVVFVSKSEAYKSMKTRTFQGNYANRTFAHKSFASSPSIQKT